MKLHSISGKLNLVTVVTHGTKVYLENEWGWDGKKQISLLEVMSGEEIQIGCRVINRTTHEKATQIIESNSTSTSRAKITKLCASEKLDCWLNFNLMETTFVICLGQQKQVPIYHSIGLTFRFKIDTVKPAFTAG